MTLIPTMLNSSDHSLVKSPITGGKDVILIRKVDCATLKLGYERMFNLDISRLVAGRREISLYKCNESGYHFYHPEDIVGDSAFYHDLEANDWYYMEAKWEFDEALKFIQKKAAVLEIGSAKGDFLNKVGQSIPGVSCVGLELNQEAAGIAQNRNLNVIIEPTSQHARTHPSSYDVIVSFQMLEHVPNPMDILRDALIMLKSDGLLIISVPDNSLRSSDSIFVRSDNLLNMPPHHQGLWDIPSLAYLQNLLPIKLEHIAIEPATARHHSNSYRGLMKTDLISRFGNIFGFVIYLIGRPFYNHALHHLDQYLPAHSVFAVFRKID